MKNKISTRELSIMGLLIGIMIVLTSTPLGFIPVGPIFATTIHIPVLIAAILLGRKGGTIMGLVFGLLSLIRAYTNPTATSFIFMDPFVSLFPRIVMGYLTGLFYDKVKDKNPDKIKAAAFVIAGILMIYTAYNLIKSLSEGFSASVISYIIFIILTIGIMLILNNSKDKNKFSFYITAAFGTAFNTFSVLSMVYFLHAKGFMEAIGKTPDIALNTILSIAVINGLPEILVAGILVAAVVGVIKKK